MKPLAAAAKAAASSASSEAIDAGDDLHKTLAKGG
jgi:hypothetical protein